MLLTKSQTCRFWREWTAACKHQGWTAANSWTRLQIDNERHALLRRAGFESLTLVDRGAGFDRVLAELGLLRDNLDAAAETLGGSEAGDRRRYLWHIKRDAAALGGMPYVLAIARDKFHLVAGLKTIDDLTLEQVRQLMITIHARRSNHSAPAPSTVIHPGVELDLATEPF